MIIPQRDSKKDEILVFRFFRLVTVNHIKKQIGYSLVSLLLMICLAGCRDDFFYNIVTENKSDQQMYQCEIFGWKQRVVWGGVNGGVTATVPDSMTITWKTIKPGKAEIFNQYKEESERLFEEYVKATEDFTQDAPHPNIKEPEGIFDEHVVEIILKGRVPKRPNGDILITYLGDEKFEVAFKKDNGGVTDSDMKRHNVAIEDGVLDLGFSKITDKGLAYLKNPEAIEVLNLQGTAVSDAGMKHLSLYFNLVSLNLNYAEITGEGFENVKLDKLKYISLEQSTIQSEYLKYLQKFDNLEVVILIKTDIPDISGLRGLKKLRFINLASSSITDEGLKDVAQMEGLEEISLLNTYISDEGIKHLIGSKSLKALILGNTDISDATVEGLSTMPSLTFLSLSGTEITDKAIEYLTKFPNLKCINLRGASISTESLKDLKQRCPDLKIETWEEI